MRKKIIKREKQWFSTEKLIVGILIFVFLLTVIFKISNFFFANIEEETETPEEVKQQIEVLTEAIHGGRIVKIAEHHRLALINIYGESVTISYDSKGKRLLLGDEVLLTDITSANFTFLDTKGTKTTILDDIRTIRVEIVHVENQITGRVKRHKLEIRIGGNSLYSFFLENQNERSAEHAGVINHQSRQISGMQENYRRTHMSGAIHTSGV